MCNAAWHGATDPVTVRCAAVLYSTLHVPGRGLTVHMCSVHRLYSPGHCTRCGIWSLLLWHSPARVAALVSSLEYNSAISFQSWEEIIPIISRVSCVGLPSQLTDFLWLLMIQYSLCQRIFAKQSLNKLSPPKNGTLVHIHKLAPPITKCRWWRYLLDKCLNCRMRHISKDH